MSPLPRSYQEHQQMTKVAFVLLAWASPFLASGHTLAQRQSVNGTLATVIAESSQAQRHVSLRTREHSPLNGSAHVRFIGGPLDRFEP